MLRELLLRDVSLHRRVLVGASVFPLIFASFLVFAPGRNAEGVAIPFLLFGLLLVALLPLTLQVREGMLGTLGDFLALPFPRRDLVRLRFLEGSLAMGVYLAFMAASWVAFHRSAPNHVWEVARSSAPLWVLLIFLAYPMPFYLRWKGKGAAAAYGLLCGALFGIGQLRLRPGGNERFPFTFFQWIGRLHDAWGATSAHLLDFGGPLLLLALFYALSAWVAERMEA